MSPIRRAILGLLSSAVIVAGCGVVSTSMPVPTPADFPTLAGDLQLSGLKIDNVVSGDAGCQDSALIPTAIGFDATGLDQASKVRIYLYVFRDHDTFERLRETIDGCARSYITDPQTLESIDQSPYVLASQGPWAPEFEAALRAGVLKAAGDGGTGGGSGDSP
jgi:hypothetical protein